MIEVITFSASGKRLDTAEADTPEAALVAARTLADEARQVAGLYIQGITVLVRFFVDGVMVREIDGRKL